MDYAQLSAWRSRLETEIAQSYATARKGAPNPNVAGALETLSEFTLRGGKRLRALLLLAGYHIASGKAPGPALPAAAAMEHFQSWMLIHDDIIDHAEERRGGPTVHRTAAHQHGDQQLLGSGDDYGLGVGITLGDLQEPFTLSEFLRCPVPPARILKAMAEYVRMTRETAYGQLLDIRTGVLPLDRVHEADVLEVHRFKTAVYTVASPLKLGAILGGGRDRLTSDLDAVGTDLGVAFQLRDDVLGAGLGTDNGGKTANDLIEGKRTLLVVKAWEKADPVGRGLLSEVLGNPSAPAEKLRAAQVLLRSTGSLDYSEAKIREFKEAADSRLAKSRWIPVSAKPLLREIGEKLVDRNA